MVPLEFPSDDMERRSVSMAVWLERPSSDSPFTAIIWSFMLNRPSCGEKMILTLTISNFEEYFQNKIHFISTSGTRNAAITGVTDAEVLKKQELY